MNHYIFFSLSHLLSLNKNEEADKVYADLKQAGFEVLYDDRDLSAGEKFADADLIACPIRLVISAKTLSNQQIELKKRNSDKLELINLDKLVTHLQ